MSAETMVSSTIFPLSPATEIRQGRIVFMSSSFFGFTALEMIATSNGSSYLSPPFMDDRLS